MVHYHWSIISCFFGVGFVISTFITPQPNISLSTRSFEVFIGSMHLATFPFLLQYSIQSTSAKSSKPSKAIVLHILLHWSRSTFLCYTSIFDFAKIYIKENTFTWYQKRKITLKKHFWALDMQLKYAIRDIIITVF